MIKCPLFSCVMPVKGDRPYMRTALESLYRQGMDDDLEIIIQDADVEPDAGQSDALNKGFAKARGEWLFWLNADDVLLPGALKQVAERIRNREANPRRPRLSWLSGNIVYIDEKDHILKCAWDRGWKMAYEGFPVRVYGPSSFFCRELLEQVGGFDTDCRYAMDIDLWCKFRANGYWHEKIPQYLWGFRIHKGSLTSGDLLGHTPEKMEEELLSLDERHKTNRKSWPLCRLRIMKLFDGSYLKSWVDTRRRQGQHWKSVAW